MDIIRPMQLGFNQRVLEHNRRFYFTASATLGIDLATGREQIDALYLKAAFQGNPEEPPLLDIGYPKPRGEFLVSGHFHAPDQKPVPAGEVKVRVGELEKSLYVFGHRQWKNGLPTEPEEIATLPLTYQNAFGGGDHEYNPGGRGFQDGRLPCIEYPDRLVTSPKDNPLPACFSPLDTMDPRRMKHKGTYDTDYKKKYFPGHPEDMDWHLFLLTPEDQWNNGFFTGEESFDIWHMHPDRPHIKGRLPGLYARCFIRQQPGNGESMEEIPLNLDTVWFFPEKNLGLLIFRGVREVQDDEAETITHILGAYEYLSGQPRSLAYYESALEKRINSDDAFLKLLTTADLIPEGHQCAMEILFNMAQSERPDESELVKNARAKSEAVQKTADARVTEALQQVEEPIDKAGLSAETKDLLAGFKEGGLDPDRLAAASSATPTDPEIEELYQQMEAIFPGITSGDPEKMDMKNFSFAKLTEISEVSTAFSEKKKNAAMAQAEEQISNARDGLSQQIADIDAQMEKIQEQTSGSPDDPAAGQLDLLKESKKQLAQNRDMLVMPDLDNPPKQPLPRIDTALFRQLMGDLPTLSPDFMVAAQHVQAQKAAGADDETTRLLEEDLKTLADQHQDQQATIKETIETKLNDAEAGFKESYLMGAHHMGEGLSPHDAPEEQVRGRFLEAIARGETVAGGDWACLDLSGENLAGLDLSGAFLEQVNFSGANLKGANLTKSNLARADLSGADLSATNLEEANIGTVSGKGANFSGAKMKNAKLSKSDFTGADFTGADLEKNEALDLILTDANFSRVHISHVFLINSQMTGLQFVDAKVELSMIIQADIRQTDFSGTVFNRCAFIDSFFKAVCFDRADLSNCAFVASAPEKAGMENMSFRQARFFQANLMNMPLAGADLGEADLEKAFFWNADLSGANLFHAQARLAQFRKADLTGANLDMINLYQGSLAKAQLSEASFKEANLCQADFLRAAIHNTDFSGANLDMTEMDDAD